MSTSESDGSAGKGQEGGPVASGEGPAQSSAGAPGAPQTETAPAAAAPPAGPSAPPAAGPVAPAGAQAPPGAPPGYAPSGVPAAPGPGWYGAPYYPPPAAPGQPPPQWGPGPAGGTPYGPGPGADPSAGWQPPAGAGYPGYPAGPPGPGVGYPGGPPAPGAPWPPPYGWGPPPPARPSPVAVAFRNFFQVFLPRAFRLHLDPQAVLPDERAALEAAEVRHPTLQAFLVWRRSLLLVAAVVLVPVTILRIIETATSFGDMTETLKALAVLQLMVEVGFAVAVWLLLPKWTSWASQRALLLKLWLVYFLFPFLVWLFPLRSLGEGGTRAQLLLMGISGALGAILTLAPRALSLMPGLLRASVISKTLFPGAAAPGWLVVLAAPIYALLVYVVLLMPYQITGSVLLVFAMILYVAAPIALGRSGFALARPMSGEEAHALISRTRNTTLALNGLGTLFLIVGLADLVGDLDLNALSAINPVLVLLANVLILSLVVTDLLLLNLDRARSVLGDPQAAYHRAVYEAQLGEFVRAQHGARAPALDARPAEASPNQSATDEAGGTPGPVGPDDATRQV